MKFVRRTLLVALIALSLCAAAWAQNASNLRAADDPRNQSPAVGTGGSEGGPTGLFTIYDGQTLRRGEFTFSVAYSNYDRDPGNVDITDVPLSFNVGVTNHLELFFKTTAYRGIKVNNPQNLSGFYLPNSQLFQRLPLVGGGFGPLQLGSPPAIVLAPNGPNVGTIAGRTLYRPPGNQPFVQFPFVGGSAGTFGLSNGVQGGLFGFPGFLAQLGQPTGGNNLYGSAANFPGIGSPVGGILPGIVLSYVQLPCTILTGACPPLGGGTPQVVFTQPTTFTIAPSYLPDAPFVNRLYGESSFNDFTIGAKWRINGINKPWGIGLVPFWRFYSDHAKDQKGFNQLQRGASPGGSIGDFGLTGFVDGRLSKRVNVSANIGYILNSNPKGTFGTQKYALLDRPDEFNAGIGFDFPINKHFQPIAELHSVRYVGGRTPNAFPNNPVEALGGFKLYPRRWFGFGAWYRIHLNSQNSDSFNRTDFNTQINQISGVFVPGRGVVIVPGTTRPATSNGLPIGFVPSEDPHGFGFQFFAGHRNARAPITVPNRPPTVTVSASQARVTLAAQCGPDQMADPNCTATGSTVSLTANAADPDGDTLLYTWSTTGGKIAGDGANVTWDLSGVMPGTYTASVEVDDGCGCIAFSSTTVVVDRCNCVPTPVPPTPVPQPVMTPTPPPPPPPTPTQFDTYGNIPRNDVKARLDNFANELQAQPGSQGYIIGYGGRKGVTGEAQRRADFAKDYLVNTRGIDAGRLVTIDGGFKEEATTELWIVPAGATPPTATPTVDAAQVQMTASPTTRRHRTTRRRRDDDE
ncbi:MAG: hypothetical protein QOE33_2154, partial [Acidobacteriota bacterium]|nr:hypothetical protein [Acidobacteriota bacterium]